MLVFKKNENLVYSSKSTTDNNLPKNDLLQSRMISDLPIADVFKYYNNDIGLLRKAYANHLANGYILTSAIIAKIFVHILLEQGNIQIAIDFIEKEIIKRHSDVIATLIKCNNSEKKKRIMFFSAHWFTGGVERFLSNLTEHLSVAYEVIIVTPYSNVKSTISLPGSVRHLIVAESIFGKSYAYTLLAITHIFNVDIAIGCMNLFSETLQFYELAFASKVKTIATNHEFYFYPYENKHFHELINKRHDAFKLVNAVVWPTNFSNFAYNCFNSNGYTIANPNTYECQRSEIIETKEKIILCVGRFNDYVKRIDRVLSCFKRVLDKIPDAKLLLVGKCDRNLPFSDKNQMTINQIICGLDIPENSIDIESETHDMGKYYKLASVLVLTSNSEGFSMILNEAAAFGVPAVCNYIPGLEDVIIDGENGFFVPQDDIGMMADRVCDLLQDSSLRFRLSENAKVLAKRFDARLISQKWLFLLDTILSDMHDTEKIEILDSYYNKTNIDYQLFARSICLETNKIVNILNENPDNLYGEKSNDINSAAYGMKFKSESRFFAYYARIRNKYKSHGLRITVKTISNKINEAIFSKR